MIKKIFTYYSFTITAIMTLTGFLGASSLSQLLSAFLFFPIGLYFFLLILPKKNKAIIPPTTKNLSPQIKVDKGKILPPQNPKKRRFDQERRAFLKVIGSAGISVFFLSLFSKKAQAAFFGSMPGPGTVALKDTGGAQINPAEKSPTDGYMITQMEADTTPAYYGYVNKDGAWYIMKEGNDGSYLYTKGSSDFSDSWEIKGDLSYNTFDNVF